MRNRGHLSQPHPRSVINESPVLQFDPQVNRDHCLSMTGTHPTAHAAMLYAGIDQRGMRKPDETVAFNWCRLVYAQQLV